MPQNPPNRIGNNPAIWLGPRATLAWSAWLERILAERDRWPLWLPVFLGAGIGLYFALPTEPPAMVGGVLLALCLAPMWLLRRHWGAVVVLGALAAAASGFTAAQVRSALVAAPVLERPTGSVRLSGIVSEVELEAGGGQRVTLSEAAVDGLSGPSPEMVRIRLGPDAPLVSVGQRLGTVALLTPPPQPAMPGAFDFARHAWYLGLGGVGRAVGPVEVLAPPQGRSLSLALNAFRQTVTARILAVLPGGDGGVAAALITGEVAGIPRSLLDAYRDSGLAHLLSISGLHMTMVAGLVFFVVRGGLALIPAVALRYNIKKWAAAIALVATLFYMLMAGSPVPAQRSFLMTGIVLVAVMLDRVALSMRMVAWAAVAVMLVVPEALIGPSFQMSFAAVAALIAAYEELSPRQAAWKAEHPGWLAAAALYVFGSVFSSLVAGSATSVYAVYHFNRFAVYQVLANLVAVPLTGIIMPFALMALLLMPLGWESLALVPMGWGVAAVNWVAVKVAALPGAAFTVPVLPLWGIVLFTLGGAWLCFWRTRWRLWGLVAMTVGLSGMAFSRPPDLLVEGRGQSFAVRTAEGGLLIQKGGRMLRETWLRRAGPEAAERWPKRGRSNDGRLSCDEGGCLYRADGRMVALVKDEAGLAAACDGAQVVLSAVPIRQTCRSAQVVVDRFDLWRRGGHAVWLTPDGARVETVAGWQGDRPWAWRPHRRQKKKVEETPSEPPAGEEGEEG